MIGKLTGTLLEKNPPQILIDCHGVGYEVDVPMSTFYNLPHVGEAVALLTHFVVREDAQILYGFATATEREAFRQLIKVTGVGPRMALGLLSGLTVAELAHAVTAQEVARLVKVPGVGKKTAERLLLELKGKLGAIRRWRLARLTPFSGWKACLPSSRRLKRRQGNGRAPRRRCCANDRP